MRNRFVTVRRYKHVEGGYFFYYKPVEFRNGSLYPLAKEDDMDDAMWGFEDIAKAWRVIDEIERREQEGMNGGRCGGSRGDREDFHSDG